MASRTTTSTEVKQRWIDKTYKQYRISLRKENDSELIEFVAKAKEKDIGVSDIFRAGIEALKKEGL